MIQIAIMGLGTVGTGVAKVVAENARKFETTGHFYFMSSPRYI